MRNSCACVQMGTEQSMPVQPNGTGGRGQREGGQRGGPRIGPKVCRGGEGVKG